MLVVASTFGGCCGVLGQQNGKTVNAVVTGNNTAISATKPDSIDLQSSTSFPLAEGAYIVRSTNRGGPTSQFRSALVSDKSSGTKYSLWYTGTDDADVLVVGNARSSNTVPEGTYHLEVTQGGTYTVTITKPTAGDAIPATLTGAKEENVVKAFNLTPGTLKINFSFEAGSTNFASVDIYDLKGDKVNEKLLNSNNKDKSKESYTAEIAKEGIYVISLKFPSNTGGQATLAE